MEHNHDNQAIDTEESTATTNFHSRRDMLKLASAVGAASLGATSLATTAAAASEPHPDPTATEAAKKDSFTPEVDQSDDVGTLAVNPGCIWESGNPSVTIYGGSCAEHAYNNSWAYAGYILDTYPGIDACRTQVSVSGEIEAHAIVQPGESITIGCGGD